MQAPPINSGTVSLQGITQRSQSWQGDEAPLRSTQSPHNSAEQFDRNSTHATPLWVDETNSYPAPPRTIYPFNSSAWCDDNELQPIQVSYENKFHSLQVPEKSEIMPQPSLSTSPGFGTTTSTFEASSMDTMSASWNERTQVTAPLERIASAPAPSIRMPIPPSVPAAGNTIQRRYNCDLCSVHCAREPDLQRHKATAHGLADVVFLCTNSECQFFSFRKDKAQKHDSETGHICLRATNTPQSGTA